MTIKRVIFFLTAAAFANFGYNYIQVRLHKVVVETRTPLWASELDAARQFTINREPGVPLRMLEAGEVLSVHAVEIGKDYYAVEVESTEGQIGWVLGVGQKGIRVVAPN